jgi:hypothetical protein
MPSPCAARADTAGPFPTAATTAGILLILGVVTSLLATALVGSDEDAHASMRRLADEEGRVIASVLLQFVTAAGAAGIAIALYPAVRSHSPTLAVGAVAFRTLEAAFSSLAALSLLGLLVLSETTRADSSLWTVLVAMRDASNYVLGVFFFGIGAGHYLAGLHRARLVPRWLTTWGMAGVALVVTAAVVTLLDGQPFAIRGSLAVLAVPIATQELTLGAWLMRFGFRTLDASGRHTETGAGAGARSYA